MKIIKKQKPFDPNHKYKPGERFILNGRIVELKEYKKTTYCSQHCCLYRTKECKNRDFSCEENEAFVYVD